MKAESDGLRWRCDAMRVCDADGYYGRSSCWSRRPYMVQVGVRHASAECSKPIPTLDNSQS